MTLSTKTLYEVIDHTWPAATKTHLGAWMIRGGQGGGQRASAATAEEPGGDIEQAETAMRELGQTPLFMIRKGDDDLDQRLAARGYVIKDPVTAWACPATSLTDKPLPRVTVFTIWEPLKIMNEIWVKGGIGPGRLAVMDRVVMPKTGLLGRQNEKPGGAAFAAIHQDVAMVHAVEIVPFQQRQGMGAWLMRGAAFWALEQGAETLSVICTDANAAANGLYASLGMQVVGQYHYRILATGTDTK
ncbi:MAG: GNAT family N-acetyltransferase [Rhodobacteraceae bacterium]|nr:GNAT family N-acetyltransferase [Paracoccaceae bacterium]